MAKIDDFKDFVKVTPSLVDHVNSDKITWQKFYEMWDVLGPEDEVWNKYKQGKPQAKTIDKTTAFSEYRMKDFANMFKNLNAEKVQSNIHHLQKGIGFLQDFFIKDGKVATKISPSNPYVPRATNKFFED